jgi:hypothetical protein
MHGSAGCRCRRFPSGTGKSETWQHLHCCFCMFILGRREAATREPRAALQLPWVLGSHSVRPRMTVKGEAQTEGKGA